MLKAIRENEPRAVSLGYKADQYKLIAFVLSAALSGLAGATKAIVFQLASLTDVHWTMSGEVVLMTLLGGLGTVFGPVVGRGDRHRARELPGPARGVGDRGPGRALRGVRARLPPRESSASCRACCTVHCEPELTLAAGATFLAGEQHVIAPPRGDCSRTLASTHA